MKRWKTNSSPSPRVCAVCMLICEWMHLERYLVIFGCVLCRYNFLYMLTHTHKNILSRVKTYHDFLVLWRVSFEWKITYMFMACLIRAVYAVFFAQLFLSHLGCTIHSLLQCAFFHSGKVISFVFMFTNLETVKIINISIFLSHSRSPLLTITPYILTFL
jgi:hypothetical protein